MTVPLSAYIDVEQTLIKRLVAAWRPGAAAAFADVRAAIITGNFERARAVATAVDMTPTVAGEKEWIKYTLYAAAKFGAMMANPGGPSALTLGAYENLLNRAYHTLLLYVTHRGNGQVRDSALQSIAAYEALHKKWGAEKRTLYVRRDVLNGQELVDWAKSVGFKTTLEPDDMHVTIVYSRTPIDWAAVPEGVNPMRNEQLTFHGGAREMALLGHAEGDQPAVLKFTSHLLQGNWRQWREAGASWDHPSYQPHVTISFDPEGLDLKSITPYAGTIVLGPEVFQAIDEHWQDKITEKFDEDKHPRAPAGTAQGGEFSAVPYFHGTSYDLRDKILREGLTNSPDHRNYPGRILYEGDRGHSVYMTKTRADAEHWASQLGQDNLILKIRLPKEVEDHLKRDEFSGAHGVRYEGAIKPEWIAAYREAGWDKNNQPAPTRWVKVHKEDDGTVFYVVIALLSQKWEEDQHPRAPAGTTEGGQFTAGDISGQWKPLDPSILGFKDHFEGAVKHVEEFSSDQLTDFAGYLKKAVGDIGEEMKSFDPNQERWTQLNHALMALVFTGDAIKGTGGKTEHRLLASSVGGELRGGAVFHDRDHGIVLDYLGSLQRGAGGMLLDKVEEYARQHHKDTIDLLSTEYAWPFYEAHGYARYGTDERAYRKTLKATAAHKGEVEEPIGVLTYPRHKVGKWDESQHPRAPSGTSEGGQFASEEDDFPRMLSRNFNGAVDKLYKEQGVSDWEQGSYFDRLGLKAYFGNSGSFSLNKALRAGDKLFDPLAHTEESLQDGFKQHAITLPDNTHVYRIVGGNSGEQLPKLKAGDTFVDKGYVSTSPLDAEKNPSMSHPDFTTVLHISTVGPMKALTFRDENELLFQKGRTFTVLSQSEHDDWVGRPRQLKKIHIVNVSMA